MIRLVAFLALASCGSSSKPAAAPIVPHAPETPATPDDVHAAVLDQYVQLSQGYDSVYLEGLLHDDRLLLIGVRPIDLVAGYDATRAIGMFRLFGDEEIELVSKNLEVHLSRDGTCAWVADDVSYRVLHGRRRAFVPLELSATYERHEGRWLLALMHLSYAVGSAAPAATSGPALPKPAKTAADSPDAEAVRKRIVAVLAGDDSPVSLEDDALVIGPSGERAAGRAVGKVATPVALFPRAGSIEPTGIRVALSKSGTVAWAAASFNVTATPARASFVLEKRGGEWRVIQTHVSRPVRGDALAAESGLTTPQRPEPETPEAP
jgi:ketosteroid isomerase-like protein